MKRVRLLELVFFATGFAGLLLQVVWQRLISLHAGVDLVASTTVVAAFMGGLGLGNLLGGLVADRLGPRRLLLVYAASVAGIGVYGWVSPWLLYDAYRAVAPSLGGVAGTFAFNVAVLAIPTTLMGVSLPLLGRGVVASIEDAAHRLSRLYAINTFGAALGAALSGWYLLGTFGFVISVRLASSLYLGAALLVLWLGRSAEDVRPPREPAVSRGPDPSWRWYVAYGITGAVALGLEVIYVRLVDALMRSNAYTFAHVLTLYLVCFATGSALGARLVKRSTNPGRTFLLIQLGIGATAMLGVLALVHMPVAAVRSMFESYFASDGYLATGPSMPETARAAGKFAFVYLLGPLTIMGLPVALMGLGYPFVQAQVSRELAHLGRGTGRLLFGNIVGNVAGSLVVSFFLIDALGSSGTLRLLAAVSVGLGVLGLLLRSPSPPAPAWAGLAVIAVGCIAVFPRNDALWAFFHAAKADHFVVVEERACVNAWVRKEQDEEVLYLNATSQNGWPYDDFHVVIGLIPSLAHPSPKRALAVGLGAGSTAWGLLQDDRLTSVECVEICGGEIDLIRSLVERRSSLESRQLLTDARSHLLVGDGRKHLFGSATPWDVITVDAMRPNGASAGNVYSFEFYELVASRLAPGGLFAQWVPTARVLETVKQVFPSVILLEVPGGRGSFLLAARERSTFDREALAQRLEARSAGLPPAQRQSVLDFARAVTPTTARAGEPIAAPEPSAINTDLFPRDEYFLNRN